MAGLGNRNSASMGDGGSGKPKPKKPGPPIKAQKREPTVSNAVFKKRK